MVDDKEGNPLDTRPSVGKVGSLSAIRFIQLLGLAYCSRKIKVKREYST